MKRFSRYTFRAQLTGTIALGILTFGLCTSLLTSWLVAERLQRLVIEALTRTTAQCATGGTLAFIVEDPGVRQRAVAACRSLPGIRYAAILHRDYSRLVSEGDPVPPAPRAPPGAWQTQAALAGEDARYWHFMGPVHETSSPRPYERTPVPARPRHLGYVHIAFEKRPLYALQGAVFAITIAIALAFCVLLLAWLNRRITQLTTPLRNLVEVMALAHTGTEHARAKVSGPTEIREMGAVFNAMMQRLEQHKDALESEVAIRTWELREARDAALSATRHKSEFLATITHEMRTPLHAILGYAEVALKELQFLDDQEPMTEWLTSLHEAATHLLCLINQILEMARLEANKSELHVTRVDLRQLIRALVETVDPLVRQSRNLLQTHLTGQATITSDQDKLFHIVLNLLTNACKFTREGAIVLRVHGGEELEIEVADTGIGIRPAHHGLIFEPFRQVDMSASRGYPGTGLGLAITKRFCELLGGRISVASEAGQGATFRVTLPLAAEGVLSEAPMSPKCHSAAAASGTSAAPPDAQAPSARGTAAPPWRG